ncbi:hypothetical protein MD484_g152, partial [Candolleomyces efflorescens]
MPTPKQPASPKPSSKPPTRSSSLRQSLTLASVGKAIIAGVRSKDSSSTADEKPPKKAKDASRRLSTVKPQPAAAPRASIGGDSRPLPQSGKRENNPTDAKTLTRKRVSGQHTRSSTDEMRSPESNGTPQSAVARGGSTLRPKSATSALPKYRAKSTAVESVKPPSPAPAKAGTRRRLSTSSEEGGKEQRKPQRSPAHPEKNARPISPLPHRAALKSSSAVNSTPPATPSTPTKLKPPSPAVNRNASPTRPAKLMKTTTASASQARPPSSASSSSATPHTPKSTLRAAITRSAQDKTKTAATPVRASPRTPARDSPSPLARHARQGSKSAASSSFSSQAGNMSHISEAHDEDSDEEDVQLLLAPIANLAAPTPAMPRIQRSKKRGLPETPIRPPALKTNPSFLAPPDSSKGHLRPTKSSGANDKANRQSILSWEHITLGASQQLGPGEAEKMLCDVAAPFSGPTSPTASSYREIPPSPCLSAIDSPSLGFGSISQVLLPDVTPSPAVHLNLSTRFSVSPEAAGESSSTYLRLQLAAAEELSNERMHRMMAMEEEIHNLKQVHAQQMEEVAVQMAHMEKQHEQAAFVALEEQVRSSRVAQEQTIKDAVARAEEAARTRQEKTLKVQRRKMDAVYSSVLAGRAWMNVGDSCKSELETIQGERQALALLLAQLEQMSLSL